MTLFALTMGVFLVTMNVTVVTTSLPNIQSDLGAGASQLEWVIDAYNLVGAAFLLSAGSLADRFGRREALLIGYTLFTVGAVLCAAAPSVGWLIGFRVLQAVGGTALTPTSLAILANIYTDPRERARAIGIWGISSGLGIGAGPVLGGAATEIGGWRAVFVVNAALGLFALIVAFRVVPRSRSATARAFDLPGQLLAVALLGTLTYALIEAPDVGWGSPQTIGLLIVSAVLAAVFAATELRVKVPLIELGFFRDKQYSAAVAITVAVFFAFGGFIYFNALYLQDARGYSPLAAGLLTLPAALPALIGGPIAGRAVAVRGPRGVLTFGTALMGLGLLALALLPTFAALGGLIAAYLVLGVGYAVINAPISTVAVASMPREQSGVAAAIASVGRNTGLVFGIAVLGSIQQARESALGSQSAADALTGSIHAAYLFAAVLLAITAVVAFTCLRSEPPGLTRGG